MSSGIKREIGFIAIALLIFGAVKFSNLHVKQVEEIHPFEMIETGVVYNDSIKSGEGISEAPLEERIFEGTDDDIIRITNEYRKEKGLDVLVRNEELMKSAMNKAIDMRDQKYFAHISPDGIELWNLVQQTGYNYSIIAENLAEGFFSAEDVVNAWMNSEGHRANILSVDLEEIGVAFLEIKNKEDIKSYVLVQHFATPQKEIREEAEVRVVCEKKLKKNCKKIDDKKEEYRDLVNKQEREIEKAEANGFSKKDLTDLYDNLKDLKEVRDQYKEFSNGCEEYIDQCDRWE